MLGYASGSPKQRAQGWFKMDIADILDAVRNGRIRITDHADVEALADHLLFDEIVYSVIHGEIIEDYPDDRPYPSCLIYGDTPTDEPVHTVWAYNRETRAAALITTYRPDPARWVNWRTRRRR